MTGNEILTGRQTRSTIITNQIQSIRIWFEYVTEYGSMTSNKRNRLASFEDSKAKNIYIRNWSTCVYYCNLFTVKKVSAETEDF